MHRENVSTLGKIVIKELSLEQVAPAQRILINRADATRFAANAVCFDR
jgi:hypothetical protein